MNQPLLEINNLKTHFVTERGHVPAVDGISLSLSAGETLALVGESGSGKSVTALSIMGLLQEPNGQIKEGNILFEGKDLIPLGKKERRKYRGNLMSMIFQEPMSALNPVMKIGKQIAEIYRLRDHLSRKEALSKAVEMLKLVGIPNPVKRAHEYPHQLSGGMRQRVVIAIALASHPKLLIADEPTTALDVTIQAQILVLMKDLQKQMGSSMILITHDLGIVYEMVDRVAVMYCGQIVEMGSVKDIFKQPGHPYTEGLLKSIPKLHQQKTRLSTIEGMVPSLYDLPQGCRFHPRCPYAKDICTQKEPELINLSTEHVSRCFKQTTEWDAYE